MRYPPRVHNHGGKRYGTAMTYHTILPYARRLRHLAPTLSREAKARLQWFDWYRLHGKNAAQTCRHFGISRETFYEWRRRYNPWRLETLEEKSRRPGKLRSWEVSRIEEFRILHLRRTHLRWGKMKIARLYHDEFQETVSSWKVQRVIEKHHVYYHPSKTLKLRKKRMRDQGKKRITELRKETHTGFLVALDTIVRYWMGQKRYILTGIDTHSKIAFARMYAGHGSGHAADFLRRIHYLFDGKIEKLQTDNGSEFAKHFEEAAQALRLPHYLSRPKTPTDNPFDERFNRTLNEEFIQMGNMTADCVLFNRRLTDWLIEYNFKRPHQALGYMVPVEYHYRDQKVSGMYSSHTSI